MNFAAYRDRFPILKDKIHLGNCSQSPVSVDTEQAVLRYLENLKTVGMDWDFWMAEVDAARTAFAKLIHAEPDEVAVVGSVSDAVSNIASAMAGLGSSHIVTTMREFPTIGHVWLANERQARVRTTFVDSTTGIYDRSVLLPHMTDQTKLLSIHHVGYANSAKQDLKHLADFAHAHGAWLFVDAYQSLGACQIDVKQEGIDMLASGCLKYLLGVPGIAFLYVRREVADQLEPSVTGWFGRVNPFAFDVQGLDFAAGAKRFQTGTPPVISAFMAKAALDLIEEVGPAEIDQQVADLSAFTVKEAHTRGLALVSPEDLSQKGPATPIRVPDAHKMEIYLANHDVIASSRGDVIRLAPHFFTTESDIVTALDLIANAI